ncbi:MAG TPA: hypothetical protein VG817_03420 [Gemmatimonadales bacterium]|nr:hypothetical protein [Gemmatimonadales bacterium]
MLALSRVAGSILAFSLVTPVIGAAQGAASVETFVAQVRAATERYQDPSVAYNDGYRRMGPDVPSMGQHWIALPRINGVQADPRMPPILEYATIDGQLQLVGVGYALMLPEGVDVDSRLVPAPASAWRYHHGEISEDALVLKHADSVAQPIMAIPRLAVLHAWVWQPNPAGVFATDNWSLPYVRMGLEAPEAPRPTAATLALALAAGGEQYFHTLLRMRYQPRPSEALLTGGILARYARALHESVVIEKADTVTLAGQWHALDRELRAACPSCSRVDGPILAVQPGTASLP